MDFYSREQPNLIGNVMKETIYNVVKKPKVNNTVSDKIANMLSVFYKEYIMEYKLVIFIIILVIGFLVFRYYNKKNKEKFANQDYNLLKDIEDYQTKNMIATAIPLESIEPDEVNKKQDNIRYPPDPLPVNIPGEGIVYTRNLYDDPKPFAPLNSVEYNYNNVYTYPSRSYYSGTYDTYKDAQDTLIMNPYGWPNTFNTQVGDFIGKMTESNQRVLADYNTIIDTSRANMLNGLKGNPTNDGDVGEYTMEPPFSSD